MSSVIDDVFSDFPCILCFMRFMIQTSSFNTGMISADNMGLEPPEVIPGWVWLVGMGPGHPGLLTVWAVQTLAQADVVFHDRLLDERMRKLAPTADWHDVGKRAGVVSVSQAEISAQMIAAAQCGQRVIRLKSGDPFMFGRGAEELEALSAAGVTVQAVPGVSVGTAGLTAANIPATHKMYNQAITFVTASGPDGGLSRDVPWASLAALPAVVIFMPLQHRRAIALHLMQAGLSGATPTVLIGRATAADAWSLPGCVQDLGQEPTGSIGPGPVLLVIGAFAACPETGPRVRELMAFAWQGSS